MCLNSLHESGVVLALRDPTAEERVYLLVYCGGWIKELPRLKTLVTLIELARTRLDHLGFDQDHGHQEV